MNKVGISLKIDVSKIDKNRLFKGAKGVYLDATAFVDLDGLDQYGNSGMITQDVSREEREAGNQGPILGNSKVFWRSPALTKGHQNAQTPPAAIQESFDDDVPF